MRQTSVAGSLFLLLLGACSDAADTESNPDSADASANLEVATRTLSWPTFTTPCAFTFRAPAGAVERPAQGVDSCVTRWTVADCELSGDSGWYTSALTSHSGEPEYSRKPVRVDGHDAELVRYRSEAEGKVSFNAAIRIVSETDPQVATLFHATCGSTQGQTTALDVFATIALQ